jgi:hypothetical protein
MTRRHANTLRACIGIASLASAGCWNGSHNETFVEAGGRFALEIETGRSDLVGTHFLVDTVTGDLWRLDTRRSGAPIWVRIADGPADAHALEDIVARIPVGKPRKDSDDDDD